MIGALTKIKPSDKLRALDLPGRHLGIFDSKITIKDDGENPLTLLIQSIQGSGFMPVALKGEKAPETPRKAPVDE